jgi:crossover junction endodeoxyribonuclease RusA
VVILRQRWDGLEPYDEPIRVNVTFHMPQPKRPKYPLPGVKPDLDKLQRALGDALTQSGLITDDSRITTWQTTKRYSHTPGITIWAITPDTGDQP